MFSLFAQEHIRQSREKSLDELARKSASLAEACAEIDSGDGGGGNNDGDADMIQVAHIHRSQRHQQQQQQQRRQRSQESANGSKEVASPMPLLGWQHSVDLSDIHQSNNASNASHERQLRGSNEPRETRDIECQTRESIFDTSLILKPSAFNGPGFTTFGYPTVRTYFCLSLFSSVPFYVLSLHTLLHSSRDGFRASFRLHSSTRAWTHFCRILGLAVVLFIAISFLIRLPDSRVPEKKPNAKKLNPYSNIVFLVYLVRVSFDRSI